MRSSQVTTLHGGGNDCTALGRVVLPNGTARHFVTRAAPSPRALRGSWFIVPLSLPMKYSLNVEKSFNAL